VPWVVAFGLAGHRNDLLPMILLAVGGLGLGTQFATLNAHLTTAAPARDDEASPDRRVRRPWFGGRHRRHLDLALWGQVYRSRVRSSS